MKAIKEILFLLLLIVYMVSLSGFITAREEEQKIGAVSIRITDSTENQFIRSAEIRSLLEQKKFSTYGKEAGSIDLEAIERSLLARQIISKAEAFVTEPGVLHIEVSQKIPFIRIFNRYGQGYYLDRKGNIIPLVSTVSPFVLVANGFISEPFPVSKTLNIHDVKHDSLSRSQHTIYDVYRLAEFITGNKFWDSQIEQIYVNNKYEIELVPRVGSHIIELGQIENLEEKMENLKLLYEEGFNKIGWNQYGKISLKYKNQVVCTKIK